MESESLSQVVYEWLLRGLLNHEFKPGDRVNRRQVAKQLGVSVAPVLEALTQLEWEGFLQSTPRSGTRVRQITYADVRGRFLLREAIETQAARVYHGAAVRKQAARLLRLAKQVDASVGGESRNAQYEIRFHRALVQLADCPVLLEEFDRVMRHSLFHAANVVAPIPGPKQFPHAHEELVAALQTDDPDAADRAIRRHLQARLARMDLVREAMPEDRTAGKRKAAVE